MKKILVLLLAMVMVLSLAACGDDSGGSSKGSSKKDYEKPLELMTEWENGKSASELIENEYKLLNGFCEKEYKALWNALQKSGEFADYMDDYEADLEEYIDSKKDRYGSDYKWSYKIEDKYSLDKDELAEAEDELMEIVKELREFIRETEEFDSYDWDEMADELDLSVSETKALVEALEDIYNVLKDAEVTDGYELAVTVTVRGSELDEPEKRERSFWVYEVDGVWLSDSWFEVIYNITDLMLYWR